MKGESNGLTRIQRTEEEEKEEERDGRKGGIAGKGERKGGCLLLLKNTVNCCP